MTHYSRQDWGARDPHAKYLLDPDDVEGIALHWPAMSGRLDTPTEVMAALRSWQNYHMDGRGWSDIAYQVAIDQLGNTYRLRGIRYRSAANGGTDVNLRFGALLLVVAPGETPSDAMVRAVRRRVRAFQRVFPNGRRIVGHGDIRPGGTECPGPAVRRLIRVGAFNPVTKD